MCPPVLLAASLAIAAASSYASYQSGNEQADAQEAYQRAQQEAHNQAAKQNADLAIKEQIEQTAAERTKQMQDNEVAANEIQKNQREMLQKKGTAVASSPYGAGLSFDALMADFERSKAQNQNVIQEQLRLQGIASDINVRGFRDSAQARISSQQGYIPAPVNRPSALAAGLGFASSAFNTFNTQTEFGTKWPGSKPPAATPLMPANKH